MNLSVINKIKIHPNTLVPAMFLLAGGSKVYSDYKIANPAKKKNIVLKDTIILAGSALGSVAVYKAMKPIPAYNLMKKVSKKIGGVFQERIVEDSLSSVERAIKDCIGSVLITTGAFGGAMISNFLLKKYLFKHPVKEAEKEEKKAKKNASAEKVLSEAERELLKDKKIAEHEKNIKTKYLKFIDCDFAVGSANNAFSAIIRDIPALKLLDRPLVAMAGFDIIDAKTFEEKFKRTTQELLANTLIPTFCLSFASSLTKSLKNTVKIPIMLGSAVFGAWVGGHYGKKLQKKLDENIYYNEMLKNWHGFNLW